MPVNETDIEMLEAYLDDALPEGEVEQVRQRLQGNSELVGVLEQLRSERTMRKALYASFEPDVAAVDHLVRQVRHAVNRERRRSGILRSLRYVAAAAACVTIGFVGRGMFTGPNSAPTNPTDKPGVAVERIASYQVTLRDETGKVVAVQRFDSIEQAQEFANDLSRWQNRSERLASGKFVVTADRF